MITAALAGILLKKIIGTRGVLKIIAIFVSVMLVGVLIAMAAVRTSSVSILYTTLSAPAFTIFSYILDATLVLIIALLLLKRHSHHSNTFLFEALECIVTAFTSFFLFLLLLSILMPSCVGSGMVYVYSAAIAIALVLVKERYHRLRDLTTSVSSIGVGLILGFNFPFAYSMFLLEAMAIYDYIGVFKTSEMMALAKSFSSNDLSFLISVSDLEPVSEVGMSDREIAHYTRCLAEEHELDDPRCKQLLREGKMPVMSHVSLGEGDLSLPLMAVISAYVSLSANIALSVLLGSVVGIFVTMALLKVYKRPLPAIPPLFAFIGIFSGSTLALTGYGGLGYAGELLVIVSAITMLVDIVAVARRMRDIGKRQPKAESAKGRQQRAAGNRRVNPHHKR